MTPREQYIQKEKQAFTKHYRQLVGKTVRQVCTDGREMFGVEFTDGTIAWILCDPEGNGPGFLDIEKKGTK